MASKYHHILVSFLQSFVHGSMLPQPIHSFVYYKPYFVQQARDRESLCRHLISAQCCVANARIFGWWHSLTGVLLYKYSISSYVSFGYCTEIGSWVHYLKENPKLFRNTRFVLNKLFFWKALLNSIANFEVFGWTISLSSKCKPLICEKRNVFLFVYTLHWLFILFPTIEDSIALNLCAGAIKVFITTWIYLGLADTIGKENSIKETDTDFPARSKWYGNKWSQTWQ